MSVSLPERYNMTKHYKIIHGKQTNKRQHDWEERMVTGEIVDTVFGVREEEINPRARGIENARLYMNGQNITGWRITHIPTGYLLVGTYFTTREDAIQFARVTRRMFGDLLETDDIAVLKRIKNDEPEYRQFYDLKERMNNVTGTFSFEQAVNL